MASFFDRAADWRRRAKELRASAERMMTPAAQASLRDMASAWEHHATNLERTALKFSQALKSPQPPNRATLNPFQRFARRPGPPTPEPAPGPQAPEQKRKDEG